eukprot:CAMPEP_0198713186 /NCGR_PEP_ID=MMETSP1471-20131121/4736_1 /TAXON_ID=41880 /ORGANISM="Pycnococcus provasolii, Strain RCC733" /LENGTH=64 /DNA_ID=CAMNT_0044473203 /DNA_START=25 /DNA_END=215 /DNA_ORIENTATION=-
MRVRGTTFIIVLFAMPRNSGSEAAASPLDVFVTIEDALREDCTMDSLLLLLLDGSPAGAGVATA